MALLDTSRRAPARWVLEWVGRYAIRRAVGISTCVLGISVATMALAKKPAKFATAPGAPDAEAAAEGEASSIIPDMIMGVSTHTLFFVAVVVFALFWFTLGGGRKPKVTRN
ncbi:MAG TPA: hypothetical protein VMY41_13945 [Thermohalobaculum sp.]|nr:hypothetical protein [Thermohalobaculum sp.]